MELNKKVKGSKKPETHKIAMNNIKTLYELREKVIKLFDDNSRIASEAKYKRKLGEDLKILILKQMLQRLLIALAQVKTGSTSENLLNEIRQIIYSLYRAKGFTKKVYNNVINSIKV